MNESSADQWKAKIISPEEVIRKIKPGMSIFIGTGVAEPRTLVRTLMNSNAGNLNDLELIQLVSFGDAISLGKLRSQQYRLKTFFSGWVAQDAIMEGRVDLIPSRFAWIPDLIESGQIPKRPGSSSAKSTGRFRVPSATRSCPSPSSPTW
jgi:acyl-CoA hydrolase